MGKSSVLGLKGLNKQKKQEVNLFPAGEHNASRNSHDSIKMINMKHKLQKRSAEYKTQNKTFQHGFLEPFCYLCFTFVFIILSCLFLAALWSPDGKGLTSCLSCV